MKNELNNVQQQQVQTLTRIDGTGQDFQILKSNLTVTRNNLENIVDSLDQKLNSTQEKQLELDSRIRDHGHGNKQRIDNMESKIATFQQQQINLANRGHDNEEKIKAVWTNLLDEINHLTVKQREITNITDDMSDIFIRLNSTENRQQHLIDKIDGQNEKVAVLWINYLESKNLIQPILQKYGRNYGESIGARSLSQNKTDAIRYEIEQINPNQINETEYKRLVTDRIPDNFSVKLRPIDSNLRKVKCNFNCSDFQIKIVIFREY